MMYTDKKHMYTEKRGVEQVEVVVTEVVVQRVEQVEVVLRWRLLVEEVEQVEVVK